MDSVFEIMMPRRIPILRNIGWFLFAWSLILLALFWLLMSPSDGSTTEMQTAYFILAIPESVKYALIFSAIILPISLIILRFTIYYNPGELIISDTSLTIVTNKFTYKFNLDDISKFQIAAGREVFFFPKISTLIIIVDKSSKKYRILLRHYQQTDEVYQLLSTKSIRTEIYGDELH